MGTLCLLSAGGALQDEKVLELNGANESTIMRMNLMPLTCTLKDA